MPHRTQWVCERGGVSWYNDSKATNVGACLAALNGMPATKIVLIAGGRGKGADFNSLRPAVAERVRALVLMGEDAASLHGVLGDLATVVRVADMEQAVAEAAQLAQPGDAVLLSPACASFDMYESYEARGRHYCRCVQGLPA